LLRFRVIVRIVKAGERLDGKGLANLLPNEKKT